MKNITKLTISIIMDIIGVSSNFFLIFGEVTDIIFAPIQAIWIYLAYDTKRRAIFGGLEELIPFTDVIPSCTIVHFWRKKINLER